MSKSICVAFAFSTLATRFVLLRLLACPAGKKTRKTAAFPQLRVFSTGEEVRIV